MSKFATATDATLAGYWNDLDGAISWLFAVEDELNARGYVTRHAVTGCTVRVENAWNGNTREAQQLECPGHPHDPSDPRSRMGETFYCDGSCQQNSRGETVGV